jgi:hypothetical protein
LFLFISELSVQTMSHVAASATTTLRATLVTTAPKSPRLKTFMHPAMKQYGVTEKEVRKRATGGYGSLENVMRAMETAEAGT